MKNEKVMLSFVTPNFNDGSTIERMVDSIMDQDYKYIEQIIVDDGSTDDSKDILKKLEKKYAPKLKVIFLEKNQGACIARNIGAKEAKGKYLSFLPADAKLYPGVARIWVQTLEDNPQFDFLYGGYKFTDAEYHEVYNYMADSFDPYFLQTSNYIDGSFPLKKDLFDQMGGWDPAVKSLQDWDLWLNAVINFGAKGLYKSEVFFETTLPHPGGLSDDSNKNWIERTEMIKRKYNIKSKRICVTSQGAVFHAKNVAKYLDADFLPMPSFKPHNFSCVYVIGFFGNVAQCFWNTSAMRVLHWIGSDILQLQQAKAENPQVFANVISWIDNNVDVNLCEMEATRKELEELGINARIIPFPPEVIYETSPLPEKPAIAVYLPYNNQAFYQPELCKELAKEMPEYKWNFFGDVTTYGDKDNIKYWGTVTGKEKDKLIGETSLILRLTPHDGLPLSVIEWISAGRRAVTTVEMDYAQKVTMDKESIKNAIKSELEKGINEEGSKYYRELCNPQVFKDKIYKLMEFDMAKWWANMAETWGEIDKQYLSVEDTIKVRKELDLLKPKTVVELGCGTGIWSDIIPGKYTGIDFSEDIIRQAKEKHPDKNFLVGDIKTMDIPKADIIFTFTCFLHLKPEEIEAMLNRLKGKAKYGVFCEPIREANHTGKDRILAPQIIKKQKEDPEFIFNVKYTWVHDYIKYLDVEKVVNLDNNRQLFVVKL